MSLIQIRNALQCPNFTLMLLGEHYLLVEIDSPLLCSTFKVSHYFLGGVIIFWLPYSDKFWHGENLAELAQNGKNRQIKSVPNLIFFSLRQIKSMAKKIFSIIKKSKFAFPVWVFSLQNKTKVSFDVYDYTLFRKKSLKNN